MHFSEPNSEKRLGGKLFLFSGKSGHVLKWQYVPDKKETYFSPVVYSTSNGTDIVLFGTGGETHPGSLWAIDLMHLYHGHIHKAISVYSDNHKGLLLILTVDIKITVTNYYYSQTGCSLVGNIATLPINIARQYCNVNCNVGGQYCN